jgi:hypothetical protein
MSIVIRPRESGHHTCQSNPSQQDSSLPIGSWNTWVGPLISNHKLRGVAAAQNTNYWSRQTSKCSSHLPPCSRYMYAPSRAQCVNSQMQRPCPLSTTKVIVLKVKSEICNLRPPVYIILNQTRCHTRRILAEYRSVHRHSHVSLD